MKKLRSICAASALALAATSAQAYDGEKYVGLMGLGYFPDSGLDLDDGGGARGYFGIPVLPNLNIEINGFGYGADPEDPTLSYIKQYGGGLDLMVPFMNGRTVTPVRPDRRWL